MAFSQIQKRLTLEIKKKNRNILDLNGEVVCITGAGSGIGALMAKKLADLGCVVVAWDVNVKGNEATVEEIR